MIRAILLTVAAMVSRPTPEAAHWPAPQPGQHQFGNVVYTLPPDWELGTSSDAVQVIYCEGPDDLCDYCYIYISAGFPARGGLMDFLTLHQEDFADDPDEPATIVVMAPPAPLIAIDAMMMGITLGSDFQILVAYDLGARFELLAFEGYATDEAQLTEGMAVFSNQISPMFDSLDFVSAGGQSLLPPPSPGTLSGLHWGMSLEQSFGLDLMLRFDLVAQSYFFWPDGQFYHGTPPGGLQPLDRTALIAAGNTDFGVYRQSGSRVMLAFANGDRRDLTVSGTALTYDDVTLPLMPDGCRIEGTITSFCYTGFTPGAGIDGGISASSSTTFLMDGTYAGESFGGGSGTFDLGGGFAAGSTENTGGRYEVRDGLITLFPADGGPSSGRIIVNTAEGIMIGDQFLD